MLHFVVTRIWTRKSWTFTPHSRTVSSRASLGFVKTNPWDLSVWRPASYSVYYTGVSVNCILGFPKVKDLWWMFRGNKWSKYQLLVWMKPALLLLFSFVSFRDSTEVLLETAASSSVLTSTVDSTGAGGSATSALGLSSELSGAGAGAGVADSVLGSATDLSVSAVKDNKSRKHSCFCGSQDKKQWLK